MIVIYDVDLHQGWAPNLKESHFRPILGQQSCTLESHADVFSSPFIGSKTVSSFHLPFVTIIANMSVYILGYSTPSWKGLAAKERWIYNLYTGQLSVPNPNSSTSPSFELSHYLGYMGMRLCLPPWLIAAKLMQQALTHLRNTLFISTPSIIHNIPPSALSATSAQVVRNDLIFPKSRGWLLSM